MKQFDATISVPPTPQVNLLGTRVWLTTYDGLTAHCLRMTTEGAITAVAFANVHWITARRSERAFRDIVRAYDLVVPDGMPLVWLARAAGHPRAERVYGPHFFRRFIEQSGRGTHFLVGGSALCGSRLVEAMQSWNPNAKVVGRYHGHCDERGQVENEEALISEINARQPDFIWVGLGTPKQDAWVHRYRNRLARGVILSVGFAFDLNAGLKTDAPEFLQRAGLGWVFRMATEPKRLISRYAKYNTRFAWHVASELIRGRILGKGSESRE